MIFETLIKDWIQHAPGTGVRYPLSGELVGHVAGFLRLKGYLREGWEGASYKTAQRYFKGERIEPATVERILDSLAAALVPDGGPGPGLNLAGTRGWMRRFFGAALVRWDVLIGGMLGGGFPILEPRLAPIPFLRLFILDAAIRWGAAQTLVSRDGSEPDFHPALLERDGVRRTMDALRAARPTITLAALAEAARVSENTLEAWRRGDQFPTDDNLKYLAAVLAEKSSIALGEVEFRLRLAVGVTALRQFLADLCGENIVADLVETFAKVARLTHLWLRFAPIPDDVVVDVVDEVIEYGAHATIRDRLLPHLAECAERHAEVRADLLALPGDWDRRLNYWCKMMTAFTVVGGFMNHVRGISEEEKRRLRPQVEERVLRMRLFDEEDAEHPHLHNAPVDANTRAKLEAIRGHREYSIGHTGEAAEHLRRALHHDPLSAAYHYDLGCFLGEMVSHGQLKRLDEAIAECRMAARLSPSWNAPLPEAAIIYSNVGMLEEAIKVFDEAEPVARGWAHYHFTRANTLMWLGRFEDAVAAFERAYQIQPRMLDALVHKAVVLTLLGRHREVTKMAPEIAHRGGPKCATPEDWLRCYPPMSELAQKLRGAGTAPPPPAPSASSPTRAATFPPAPKVGRNEPCPCGSGKKYKKCHGGADA